jgi:hypothetical protein
LEFRNVDVFGNGGKTENPEKNIEARERIN